MEIIGYFSSLLIGLSLGLIGGGGSILTIPVLVYLFAFSPSVAIPYSLFIVGVTSLVSASNYFRKGLVQVKTALLFGTTSVTTVFLTRKFVIPILPDVFFTIGNFEVTHDLFVMVIFAMLMILASVNMIRGNKIEQPHGGEQKVLPLLLNGIAIGIVTGFLGAGGGFLIIPALVLLMKMPMKSAVGTSLFIIALNSIIGFLGDIEHQHFNWTVLILISVIAIGGSFLGSWLNHKVDGHKLKKGFGWFVMVMGIYIIFKEVMK